MIHIYCIPPSKVQRALQKRRQERCKGQKWWMTIEGSSREAAQMNSQRLWKLAQDRCKNKQDKFLAWRWALHAKSHTDLWPVSHCYLPEEEVTIFSKRVALGKSTMLQWKAIHPGIFEQHKLVLMTWKKQNKIKYTNLSW